MFLTTLIHARFSCAPESKYSTDRGGRNVLRRWLVERWSGQRHRPSRLHCCATVVCPTSMHRDPTRANQRRRQRLPSTDSCPDRTCEPDQSNEQSTVIQSKRSRKPFTSHDRTVRYKHRHDIITVIVIVVVIIIMVALCNRADHYIFALWFLSIFFFPRLISAVGDWMSTILPNMVWP